MRKKVCYTSTTKNSHAFTFMVPLYETVCYLNSEWFIKRIIKLFIENQWYLCMHLYESFCNLSFRGWRTQSLKIWILIECRRMIGLFIASKTYVIIIMLKKKTRLLLVTESYRLKTSNYQYGIFMNILSKQYTVRLINPMPLFQYIHL
jgi:hypothetical protein